MPLGIGLKFIASAWDQMENAVLAKRFSKMFFLKEVIAMQNNFQQIPGFMTVIF